ncbi:MAG: hypothetical protein CMJ18_01725 [Phycisphaeraceae bacterium]|nr:hypothetical protein [Phycisphaeraceae bacterium]
MRIGILQVWQESNQFNPVLTLTSDFRGFRYGTGSEGLEDFGRGEEVGGFLRGLEKWKIDVEPVGLFMAQAWPGGTLARETEQWLMDSLMAQIGQAGALDGLLFSLHGALCSEDEPDVDGQLLKQVRSAVGARVPIVATIDLHAHLTPRMLRHADVIMAYHTNPHVDRTQTGIRAARALARMKSGARPFTVARRLPMIATAERGDTDGRALKEIFEALVGLETNGQAMSAAVLMTQPWLDVPGLGWSVSVTTDNAPRQAQVLSREIAGMCWKQRDQLKVQYRDAAAAVNVALEVKGKPVVIADSSDSTNSGAPGDSVHLLRELIAQPIPGGALTFVVDPEAVARASEAGVGGAFKDGVGGKRDTEFSKPLPVEGEVLFLKPVHYTLRGHLGDALPIDMGLGAAVRVGDATVLLVERTGPGSSPQMYRCIGLEPMDFKIVIVKSPRGFRADYGPFAAKIILCGAPGCAMGTLKRVPYTNINRPLWPLDEIDDWREVEWSKPKFGGPGASVR